MKRHLTTTEVALIFGVHPDTVRAWANTGKLDCSRTLGGERRFDPLEVERARKAAQ